MIFKVLSQISITLCLCTWIHSNEGQVLSMITLFKLPCVVHYLVFHFSSSFVK